MHDTVDIRSRDGWVKVVDMLQHNWALLEPCDDGVACHFIDDAARVFDRLAFADRGPAAAALRRNGFERYAASPDLQACIATPKAPLQAGRARQRGDLFLG